MRATSVISAHIRRSSPSDHRVGFSDSFTRLRLGSLALRPALLLCGNSRPRVTATPLPHATGAYGQLPRWDFNPLDLLLLLRTARLELFFVYIMFCNFAAHRVHPKEYSNLPPLISFDSQEWEDELAAILSDYRSHE